MYPLLASQNQLNTKNVCNDTYLPYMIIIYYHLRGNHFKSLQKTLSKPFLNTIAKTFRKERFKL